VNSSIFSKALAALCCLSFISYPSANADVFDWTSTDVQVLYGTDFKLGDKSRTTVTVEHSDGWRYGSNFFFVDTISRNDVGAEIYAEVYSYLSFNKISGLDISFGPLKDISLMLGLNIGNKPENDSVKSYLLGLNFEWSVPFFDYLKLSASAYKNDNVHGKYGLQVTPVWSVPFEVAGLKFKFRGFTDFNFGYTNTSGTFSILSQPQLLFDVGDLVGLKSDKVYIGTEYYHWHNKYGIKGIDEHVVQAMIIGFFSVHDKNHPQATFILKSRN
jgi:nucleoside-specific outer membrane channel protein Tsx